MRAHRCTVEQIAIQEPGLSETAGARLSLGLRDETDEAESCNVPRAAAHDFILGHLTIEFAIAFGIFPKGQFSDGTLHAIEQARALIFRDGWLDAAFAPEVFRQSVEAVGDA